MYLIWLAILQQFHEALSSKARRSIKSPSGSSQEEDRGHLLEAKLVAAKQKRYPKEEPSRVHYSVVFGKKD